MEWVAELSWMDLVVILLLAGGVFFGYTQGIIRGLLNSIVVLVAFVLSSLLAGPIFSSLGFWTAFTDDVRLLVIYLFLFSVLTIGGWFGVRAFFRQTRVPIPRFLDELGGAVMGFVFMALLITFHLVVLDSLFGPNVGREVNTAGAGFLQGWHEAFNDSIIVAVFRETLLPTA